jgi:hypothetical protein
LVGGRPVVKRQGSELAAVLVAELPAVVAAELPDVLVAENKINIPKVIVASTSDRRRLSHPFGAKRPSSNFIASPFAKALSFGGRIMLHIYSNCQFY